MPKIEQNFNNEILELISTGTTNNQFRPDIGHYVRMSVFDERGDLVANYYSHLTWSNTVVYWNHDNSNFIGTCISTDGGTATDVSEAFCGDYADGTWTPNTNSTFYLPYNDIGVQDDSTQIYFTGEPECESYPSRCNNIQLPLYFCNHLVSES